jgi:hypothetical protein
MPRRPVRQAAALLLCAVALAGCASSSRPLASTRGSERVALERYLVQIEPLRLGVNRLLEGADPILQTFADRRITPSAAARRMQALERRFAAYAVDVAAIEPQTRALRSLHEGYANTYVLEDAYLSALASGLADGAPAEGLPDTQAAQRAAIIRWRTGLAVMARASGIPLPADLQRAGRGEIAPAPSGS